MHGESTKHILYPAYINKSRTVARGRRIPLEYAVVDPKPTEIMDAFNALKGFQTSHEFKPYCRELDKESTPSRFKYENVHPELNKLKTKREILIACARRINEVRSKSGPAPGQSNEGSGKQKKKK